MSFVSQAKQPDKCPEHPGVKWWGDLPCFVCQPEAWTEAPWIENQVPAAQDATGVAGAVAEMVASGHWPPMEVVLSRVPDWNGDGSE